MKPQFSENRQRLQSYLQKAKVDAAWITSRDPFLSEYTPLENNHRYGITGFTGSLGEALFFTDTKKCSLVVDGRYHLQADQECDSNWVEVVKIEVEPQIEGSMLERVEKLSQELKRPLKIGLVPERFSEAGMNRIQEKLVSGGHQLVLLNDDMLTQSLGLPGWKTDAPIRYLNPHTTGRSLSKNLESLSAAMKAKSSGTGICIHVSGSTDDAAFLLNSRGFHLPYSSSVLAYTFYFSGCDCDGNPVNELIVYLPSSSEKSELIIPGAEVRGFELNIIRNNEKALREAIEAAMEGAKESHVFYNGSTLNGWLTEVVLGWVKNAAGTGPSNRKVDSQFKWVIETRVKKTQEELKAIRGAFLKSSKAIAKTLRWGKEESSKRKISEKEVADYLYDSYRSEGAVTLSFKTISGAGPNSAIVHYTANSPEKKLEDGEMFLLDSGAYYEEGFATDCTRGFFVRGSSGKKPEAWQKKIYTSALKAAISVFLNPVPKALTGKQVDELVRSQVKAAGYDYLHGTGHGIGIHVHEDGIRFSTLSTYGQSDYACVSVEPGIYLTNQGGVRIENVVFLIPEGENYYEFENIVWVGYDWDYVDLSLLTPEEKEHLKTYEARCRELGTQLMDCPL